MNFETAPVAGAVAAFIASPLEMEFEYTRAHCSIVGAAFLEVARGVTQEAEKFVSGNVELKGTGFTSVLHTHWIAQSQRMYQKISTSQQ